MYCCSLWVVSPALLALAARSENPPNIAIDQQVDHHDDRYNPATHNSEMVEEMNFGKALRCMVGLHQLISWFEFLLTLKACQNSAFEGCAFVLNKRIINVEL